MPASIETVPLDRACRLINHGPTVLVACAHQGRRNLMAAAWSMPVEFAPPRIAVVIDKSTYTRELILAAGAFAIGVPCRDGADLTFAVGSETGREVDKFARHALRFDDGPCLGQPLVRTGCVAWLECRRIPESHAEAAYDTFFAEVVHAEADARVFRDGRWRLDEAGPGLQTLHHLGAGRFALAADTVQAHRPAN